MKKCIAVAMSGGVDSSVTAGLLREEGYDVIGVTLRLWEDDSACLPADNVHACCSLSSVDDAKAVATVLGIPHYTLDFRDVFRRDVIDYFVAEYAVGRTPNPCIACNKFIKFGLLWDKAKQFGADFWRPVITRKSPMMKKGGFIHSCAAPMPGKISRMSYIS